MAESVPDMLQVIVPESEAGIRLDKVLARLFTDFSRSQLQQWLKEGRIRVGERVPALRESAHSGDVITLDLPIDKPSVWHAQALPLNIVYEDAHLAVVDKPAGMVVHPGAGNWDTTLANALLHRYPESAGLPRAGIVHRLDKDTSGLLVVARTPAIRQHLIRDLERHEVARVYSVVVNGRIIAGGHIVQPIGRHPRDRLRMAVHDKGKRAVTNYRVEQRFRAHTLLRVQLETGRTHQIRVHFAHTGNPLVGDPRYGGRLQLPKGASEALVLVLRGFKRQALHARELAFRHPHSGETMTFSSALPEDLEKLLAALLDDTASHQ